MTNHEKIKQMSVEEFIKIFGGNSLCDYVQDNYRTFCNQRDVCGNCLKEWLEQEVDE